MGQRLAPQKPDEVSQKGGSRMEIAKVSQVNYKKGLVRLTLENKEESVTNWIPYLSFEYEMPKVGDVVLYVPENTNYQNPYYFGLCLGRYYNKGEMPKLSGKEIYYKAMLGDVIFIYNADQKKLTIQTEKEIEINAVKQIQIKAKKIALEGEAISLKAKKITLQGEVTATGNQTITGNVTINGKSNLNGDTQIQGNLRVSGAIYGANI